MIKKRGRIGFITTSFPRRPGDFAGNFVFHMAEAFASQGYLIDVVFPEAPPTKEHNLKTNLSSFSSWLSIYPVQYMIPRSWQRLCYDAGAPENLSRSPLRAGLIPPLVYRMWQQIGQLADTWDGMVSHWLLPSAVIAPRVPGINIPHLAIAHSGDVHLMSRLPGKQILGATIARRCKAINFVTTQLKNDFVRCLPDHLQHRACSKMHVTPMGVPPNTCTMSKEDARRRLGWKDFIVLYVGRLIEIKGITDLVSAMTHCDGKLIVAGDGERRCDLEKFAKILKIDVKFYGTVSSAMRDMMLRGADVLVIPSIQLPNGRHEGAPTVLSEAQQAGLPVVATATGGIPERVLHNHNGMLVPEKSPVEIGKAVNIIKENNDFRQKLIRAARASSRNIRWDMHINKFTNMLFE